jgi:glycosyltransferase involved in cell wall biosynthesis
VNERGVCLATDSELLAKKYTEITGMDFKVLPIPHTEFPASGTGFSASPGGPIQFVFPGNARLEKGIDTLTNAIPLLERELATGRISLRIQCNLAMADRWVTAVVGTLEQLQTKYPGISLLQDTLSQSEYRNLLAGADVVIIPYKRQTYSMRTSGPCAEALSLAKPVIVPEDTWMSLQAMRYGGAVVFQKDDENDLAVAIVTAAENFEMLSRKARENCGAWRSRHNADQFCTELLSCPV